MDEQLTESVTPQAWVLVRRVLPQHTDHAGVMWHGSYVAWMEEGRVLALEQAGLSYAALSALGYEMPVVNMACLLYTSPSPRDKRQSRMPSSA